MMMLQEGVGYDPEHFTVHDYSNNLFDQEPRPYSHQSTTFESADYDRDYS
jgi:hypothetical protein